MPELPEVETVRRGVVLHLPGRRLALVTLRREDLRWPIPAAAVTALKGRRCTAVGRRSKYLLLEFSGTGSPTCLIHLGMSGRLAVDIVRSDANRPPWELHEHWRMDFGERLLRYVDPRRFGALDIAPAAELDAHRLLAGLGREPLERHFHTDYLQEITRRRKTSVKNLLMDARRVVGVGNIYASEACHRAGVRPRRAAGRLTRAQCERLATAVKQVLREAIAAGGTTLRDHAPIDAKAGYFGRRLAVYGREGLPCPRCGDAVKRIVQGARSSYYCPGCQE